MGEACSTGVTHNSTPSPSASLLPGVLPFIALPSSYAAKNCGHAQRCSRSPEKFGTEI